MATILVTGSKGQLGSELQFLSKTNSKHNWLWTDVAELDITNAAAISAFFDKNQPDFVINTAAFTAVDKAESNVELCHKINVIGPELLTVAANKHNAVLIQISSDYVYDNGLDRPILESDPTKPKSVYAETKLGGDLAVLKHSKNIVLRTSWVYSSFGHNFVKTMILLGSERDLLTIVDDQIGTPTYARDLAKIIIDMVEKMESGSNELSGIYHFSNEGVCSWFDFAKAIFEEEKINCKIKPIPTIDYPLPARRPSYSVLNKGKIRTELGIEIPHWRDALRACLVEIRKSVG